MRKQTWGTEWFRDIWAKRDQTSPFLRLSPLSRVETDKTTMVHATTINFCGKRPPCLRGMVNPLKGSGEIPVRAKVCPILKGGSEYMFMFRGRPDHLHGSSHPMIEAI